MRRIVSAWVIPALTGWGLCMALASAGCGGDDNEREFLRFITSEVPNP